MEVRWVWDGYHWTAIFFEEGKIHTPSLVLREHELVDALRQLQYDKVYFEKPRSKNDE